MSLYKKLDSFDICEKCASVVTDKIRHTAWHYVIDKILEKEKLERSKILDADSL